jgi:membrane protein DedA with SNARE-associated domain
MVLFVSIVWAIGWFLLATSGGFVLVAWIRGKETHVKLAGPFLLIVGLPSFLCGQYLLSQGANNPLLFFVPGVLGAVCGAIAGYGAEEAA